MSKAWLVDAISIFGFASVIISCVIWRSWNTCYDFKLSDLHVAIDLYLSHEDFILCGKRSVYIFARVIVRTDWHRPFAQRISEVTVIWVFETQTYRYLCIVSFCNNNNWDLRTINNSWSVKLILRACSLWKINLIVLHFYNYD